MPVGCTHSESTSVEPQTGNGDLEGTNREHPDARPPVAPHRSAPKRPVGRAPVEPTAQPVTAVTTAPALLLLSSADSNPEGVGEGEPLPAGEASPEARASTATTVPKEAPRNAAVISPPVATEEGKGESRQSRVETSADSPNAIALKQPPLARAEGLTTTPDSPPARAPTSAAPAPAMPAPDSAAASGQPQGGASQEPPVPPEQRGVAEEQVASRHDGGDGAVQPSAQPDADGVRSRSALPAAPAAPPLPEEVRVVVALRSGTQTPAAMPSGPHGSEKAAGDQHARASGAQRAEAPSTRPAGKPVQPAAEPVAEPIESVVRATMTAAAGTDTDTRERDASQSDERRAGTKLRVPDREPQRAFESVVRADAPASEVVRTDAPRPGQVTPEAPVTVTREHLDTAALLGQIGAGARRALELSRVSVQLNPPDLGTIHIAVQSRQGQLSAHFHATHPAVGAWLESHADSLRSELTEAGLSLQHFSLSGESWQRSGRWLHEPASGSKAEQRLLRTLAPMAEASEEETRGSRSPRSTIDWRA